MSAGGPGAPECSSGPWRGRVCLPLLLAFALSCNHSSAPLCGNGRIDPGEACDDGNRSDGDCCSSSCQLTPCPAAQAPLVSWEEVGPFSIGGRASALAVDPQNRQILWAGTPAGGVWRSSDGGQDWAMVSPWLATIPISALAVHPSDSKTILAGTGSLADGGTSVAGAGILRTSDGGQNWSIAPSTLPPFVGALLFWQEEPDVVLAGTDNGVLRSADGGATFAEVLHTNRVAALVRDPFVADALYAAGATGLYRSSDRGQTWAALAPWPLLASDMNGVGRVALAVSAQTPALLLASVQVLGAGDQTDRVLLLRSTDGGQSTAPLAGSPNLCPTPASCGFALAIAVDPANDAHLLVGGDKLYASADGGATWNDLGTAAFGIHSIALDLGGGYVAGAFGVAALDSAWSSAALRNHGLAIARVLDLDVSADLPTRLVAATGDTGTLLATGTTPDWNVVFGQGEAAGPARFDPLSFDRLYVSQLGGSLFRSEDRGATFGSIVSGLDLTQMAVPMAPVEPSRLVSGTAYAGRAQVFSTTNAGDSWSPYRPSGSPPVACIAPSPIRPGRVYFSLATGPSIYKADGTTTDVLTPPADPAMTVHSIFLDPGAENVLYVAGATADGRGHVYKSQDFGANWTDITSPDMHAAYSMVKDRYGALYVGTATGVLRSANDGLTWSPFNYSLLAGGVTSLRLASDYLYAGTDGRGVFRMSLHPLATIDSIPPGGRFLVDGVLETGPILASWPSGTSHTVVPYLLQTADTRQQFVGWIDGGSSSREVTGTGANQTLTAVIRTSYLLSLSATPPGSGAVAPEQTSPDSFYSEGSVVQLVASPANDQRFVAWQGAPDLALDVLAAVVMGEPRSISATFEPLQMKVLTDPPGLPLRVDGVGAATPTTYQWSVDSVHALEALATVDLDPTDPVVLVFDHWSDLQPRAHLFTVRRDTFVTDLTATYISTVPSIGVPAGGAQVLRTPGEANGPRVVSLSVTAGAVPAPETAAILSGSMSGVRTVEAVLSPATTVTELDTFVEGGSTRGQTRLVIENPGSGPATVSLLLRDPGGAGIVGVPDAFSVAPQTTFVGNLQDVMLLSPVFEGLLSVISDQPVHVSVQSIRTNLRPSTLLDPVLVVPFTTADANVPRDARVQVLLLGADTEQRLVLFNPGTAPATGTLNVLDEQGAPLPIALGATSTISYAIPPGGYAPYRYTPPAPAPGTSALTTCRAEITPDAGQTAPRLLLVEEHTYPPPSDAVPGPVLPRAVPPSRLATTFLVPVDLPARDSGVVLTNPGPSSVLVSVSLRGTAGDAVATTAITVAPGGQVPLLTSEVFPAAGPVEGVLEVDGAAEVWGVGVLRSVNARGEEILAGFPAFAGEQASATLRLPYLVDGDSWSTNLWLLGASRFLQAGLATRGTDGVSVALPMVWP
ncbi:MAG TPA: hypothetical protein VMK42_11420 [Anaeromyxobacteraceae bacterium]|nr:hypothetical protein [Anaeromyxobacteraceae bacterium]